MEPDPYLGTVDPSGFDVMVRFQPSQADASRDPTRSCLVPRRGIGGASGLDNVQWIYLGALTDTQLDITNASDPARALPPSVYSLTGCNAPEGHKEAEPFDPRLHNYKSDRQFPLVSTGFVPAQAGNAPEPTSLRTYKPWHMVVPATLSGDAANRLGCNDVKSERSVLERAGWDRQSKQFNEGNFDVKIQFPTRDMLRQGMVTFKDWPMVNVGVPVMKTPDGMASCPFVSIKAKPPRFPGDPDADFQFPSQHWLRGLLGGYLDGGDVPLNTSDPLKCPALVKTGKPCGTMMPCDTAKGEICSMGSCLGRLPVCPVINDLYVSTAEVKPPSAMGFDAANPIPAGTLTLTDTATMMTRTADILSAFGASPDSPGFSPVCRLHFYDVSKLTCTRKEDSPVAARPVCTAAEIKAQPMALVDENRTVYVHCLFLKSRS